MDTNDENELQLFEEYMNRVAAGEKQDEAYAAVYGEVVFEDAEYKEKRS